MDEFLKLGKEQAVILAGLLDHRPAFRIVEEHNDVARHSFLLPDFTNRHLADANLRCDLNRPDLVDQTNLFVGDQALASYELKLA
ncbi:hypothetical protein KL86PLE_100757 [uncultured Pleomorphomonas sp.]|uniref:Uncharacterized protein n=1 Tax=uncultured Pleomorphomonas sp. TaxID=442121 RepID=A0A212L5T1_9HYPH|nr:hypothetical protein KL86PLE_100757 [uncultured Pleomorphomonas sp.]